MNTPKPAEAGRPPAASSKVAQQHLLESDQLKSPVARKGSFVQTMQAVAWSFFGVRRSADHAQDVARLNPVHVIIAGFVGAGLFVTALVFLVKWVVGSGVAT